jgi:hypothetical protein
VRSNSKFGTGHWSSVCGLQWRAADGSGAREERVGTFYSWWASTSLHGQGRAVARQPQRQCSARDREFRWRHVQRKGPTRGSMRGAATNQGLRGGPGEDGRDDGVLSSGVVAVGRMSRRSGAAWRYARTCAWCRAETRVLERGLGHNCLVNARLTDVKFRKK